MRQCSQRHSERNTRSREEVAVVRRSSKPPLTAAEVVLLRRVAKAARLGGLVAAILVALAALVVAADGNWATGLIFVAAGVLVYLNFGVYAPWIFERIIRKRGVLAE